MTVPHEGQRIRLLHMRNKYSEQEWTQEYSRHSPLWSSVEQRTFYGRLKPGEFYIPYSDYLKNFKSTCINIDAPSRAHYQISSAGISMRERNE